MMVVASNVLRVSGPTLTTCHPEPATSAVKRGTLVTVDIFSLHPLSQLTTEIVACTSGGSGTKGQPNPKGGTSDACYKCGEEGHWSSGIYSSFPCFCHLFCLHDRQPAPLATTRRDDLLPAREGRREVARLGPRGVAQEPEVQRANGAGRSQLSVLLMGIKLG